MAFQDMFDNRSFPTGESLAEGITHGQSLQNVTASDDVDPYHPITSFIEMYTIPVISIFGLIGNTVASLVFLQKPLRKSSCCLLLAVRGVSDNGFLSTLIIIWISRTFKLQLGMLNGSCRVIIFLSYVCGCVSAWLVVFVTIENYFRICRPFLVTTMCTNKVVIRSVAILCLNSIGFYHFPFWAMTADECVPYDAFHNTVQAFVYIDILITLVLPLICIVIVMSAILCALLKFHKIRKRRQSPVAKKLQSPMEKVTNMLLAVTFTFFCFCLPSHVNRIRLMLSNPEGQQVYNALLEEAIQQILLQIYYLSLSTNIIVYIMFCSRFRKTLKLTFKLSALKKGSLRKKISKRLEDPSAMVDDNNAFPETNIKRNLAVSLSNTEKPCHEIVHLREYESL